MDNEEIPKKRNTFWNSFPEESDILSQSDIDLRKSFDHSSFGLTHQDLWLLCIDARDHDKGRLVYDTNINREPGYIRAMENAAIHMFQTIEEPLSVELIQKLHKMANDRVSNDVCNSVVDFGRMPSGKTNKRELEAEVEDLQEILSYGFADLFGYATINEKETIIYLSVMSDLNLLMLTLKFFKINYFEGMKADTETRCASAVLHDIIKEYNQTINSATTADAKLLAIARCAKQIDTLHPFFDGNIRTIVLVINKLLHQNGFPLVMMENPNDMDVKSSRWIVENQIKPGIARFCNRFSNAYPDAQSVVEQPNTLSP